LFSPKSLTRVTVTTARGGIRHAEAINVYISDKREEVETTSPSSGRVPLNLFDLRKLKSMGRMTKRQNNIIKNIENSKIKA